MARQLPPCGSRTCVNSADRSACGRRPPGTAPARGWGRGQRGATACRRSWPPPRPEAGAWKVARSSSGTGRWMRAASPCHQGWGEGGQGCSGADEAEGAWAGVGPFKMFETIPETACRACHGLPAARRGGSLVPGASHHTDSTRASPSRERCREGPPASCARTKVVMMIQSSCIRAGMGPREGRQVGV